MTQPTKILIVDDDPFVRMMLGELLETAGYRVSAAVSGTEALSVYLEEHEETDLIISDMNMAEMNGIEFIKSLRGTDPEVPVIILTVNTEISVALEAIRSGASDYLLKDENIHDTILHTVERTVEKQRLKERNRRLMEELARKNRELERLSYLDELTDIPNRRYFDKVIEQEWLRAVRGTAPLTLMMIDIDFFKRFNDTYGHQEGDRCLRGVAKAIEGTLKRSGDFVARYGGEEFAAILPETNLSGAIPLAEEMRRQVSGLQIPHKASDVSPFVSISLGIGIVGRPDRRSLSAVLVSLADQALYEAKRGGRNRVKIMCLDSEDGPLEISAGNSEAEAGPGSETKRSEKKQNAVQDRMPHGSTEH